MFCPNPIKSIPSGLPAEAGVRVSVSQHRERRENRPDRAPSPPRMLRRTALLPLLLAQVGLMLSGEGAWVSHNLFDGHYTDCPSAARLPPLSGVRVERTGKDDELQVPQSSGLGAERPHGGDHGHRGCGEWSRARSTQRRDPPA